MSLQKHICYAESHNIDIRYQFRVILTSLFFTRPLVCIEAMDSNVEFFIVAVSEFHAELVSCAKTNPSLIEGDSLLELHSRKLTIVYGKLAPLHLMRSLCVVLSIWNDQNVSDECKNSIQNIADALLLRDDSKMDGIERFASLILEDGVISPENV